jgi:hypothetical protein
MSTPKTLAPCGQSCAASHAAVIHRHIPSAANRPAVCKVGKGCRRVTLTTKSRFLLTGGRMPPVSHELRARGEAQPREWQEIALPCTGPGDEPGSARIEVPAILDGERACSSRRATARRSPSLQWRSSMACCTRRVRWPRKRGPDPTG